MAETKKKPAAKKPAVKKASAVAKPAAAKKVAVAKKPAVKKAAPKKAAAKKPAAGKPNKISAEERYRMVEVAAYFMAERNKFAGNPVGYWAAAEVQIKKMLS
ncbi:MAG TPA: DUF2934 domain-containing protein [Methylophilaceae bacterium]|nr:DUF2934 domain-containing protein [Methylophilaceae bacterium]